MDYPQSYVTPLFINTYSEFTSAPEMKNIHALSGSNLATASLTWPSANRAFFIPLWLPFPYNVRRVFWGNGSGTGGNTDVGVYNWDGVKILSGGGEAQSGTSTIQYSATAINVILSPGRYYLAAAYSGTTNVAWGLGSGSLTTSRLRLAGCFQQASAYPLPSTFAISAVGSAMWPLFGITQTASGF